MADFTLEVFYIDLSRWGILERHRLFYDHKVNWKCLRKANVNRCLLGSCGEW